MPKAALFFKLPEENQEHMSAIKGGLYLSLIQEMDDYLRARLKYEDGLSEEVRTALQEARNKLNNMLIEIDT